MNLKQNLEITADKLCEILIPIKHEYYIGGGKQHCYLHIIKYRFLQTIAARPDIMHGILVAGRLLSENKGLYKMISSTPNSVCGRKVRGHKH